MPQVGRHARIRVNWGRRWTATADCQRGNL